jgi:hypothetical protein
MELHLNLLQLLLYNQLRKLQALGDREKLRVLLSSASREIKLEGLAMGSIFLAVCCISESGCGGRRKPKGNSFIKKAIISHRLMATFHFLMEWGELLSLSL